MKSRKSVPFFVLLLALLLELSVPPITRASTDTKVTIVASNQITSLNPEVKNDNLIVNKEADYLQRSGFFYLNDRNEIVANQDFGRYEIVSQVPFRVRYSIKPGQVWSDGTPITAVDLLLNHVICSSRYSISANLGNPAANAAQLAFNSNCYGGAYGERHLGIPSLSADKMSLTVEYDRTFPEWLLFSPKPFPVHALVLISEGRNQLQNLAISNTAKERFERAVIAYDSSALAAYGNVWSRSYKLGSSSSSPNPLLLISNGGYIIDSFVPGQSISFRYNDNYGSGPEVQGISRIVFRFIADGTAAAQALQNGEVDILQGQPTADSVSTLQRIANIRIIDAKLAIYEHLDIRTGKAADANETYNGIFSGDTQRARELRKAFLLSVPRDEIVNRAIRPVANSSSRLDSFFYFNNDSRYENMVTQNDSSVFTSGTQEQREAQALALVRKYYPNASATNPVAKVNLLWGTPTNARRASVSLLIRTAASRAGFDVNAPGLANWSVNLNSSSWDASFFAWVRPDFSSSRNLEMYCGTCGNNYSGWNSPTVNTIYQSFVNEVLTEEEKFAKLAQAEREIYSNAWSIPLFQHPGIYAVRSSLSGVSPASTSMPLLWNYWDWKIPGTKPFPRYLVAAPTPTPTPTSTPTTTPTPPTNPGNIGTKPKPANPTFSLVNFTGNKINISVNLGTGSSRADKVYLVAPKLGYTGNNPSVGTISGDTANWTIELDKILSGSMIPLEIISEKDGVRSDTVTGNYQAPSFAPVIKSVPAAPTNLKSRIVGTVAVITATAKIKSDALASGAYLFGKSLGISKNKAIEGEVVGNKVLLEVPIKNSMAGKKFPITVFLTNEKGESKPLNGTLSVPAISKPKAPVTAPKPTNQKTVLCFFGSQSRPFPGDKCPPGWTEG